AHGHKRQHDRHPALHEAWNSRLHARLAEEQRLLCRHLRRQFATAPYIVTAAKTPRNQPRDIAGLGHIRFIRRVAVWDGKGREIYAPPKSADCFYRWKRQRQQSQRGPRHGRSANLGSAPILHRDRFTHLGGFSHARAALEPQWWTHSVRSETIHRVTALPSNSYTFHSTFLPR